MLCVLGFPARGGRSDMETGWFRGAILTHRGTVEDLALLAPRPGTVLAPWGPADPADSVFHFLFLPPSPSAGEGPPGNIQGGGLQSWNAGGENRRPQVPPPLPRVRGGLFHFLSSVIFFLLLFLFLFFF